MLLICVTFAGYTWMEQPARSPPPEEAKEARKDAKRPYKRKHEAKKLAEIQNKYVTYANVDLNYISLRNCRQKLLHFI